MRPKCEYCGERLYRINKRFSSPLPDHCPSCGEKLSSKKKNQIIEYEWIFCIIAFIIILIVIGIAT